MFLLAIYIYEKKAPLLYTWQMQLYGCHLHKIMSNHLTSNRLPLYELQIISLLLFSAPI